MEDSNIEEYIDEIDANSGMFHAGMNGTTGFLNEHGQGSLNLLGTLIKHSLLLGAEKALLSRKSPRPWLFDDEDAGKNLQCFVLPSRRNHGIGSNDKYEHHFPALSDCPSYTCSAFPLDLAAFLRMLTLLVLDLAGFLISLLAGFFLLPVELFNFWIQLLTFPFRTLGFVRQYLKNKLLKLWSNTWFSLIYFVCDRIKIQKSLLKLGVRLCWGFFWSLYVCLILVGLVVLGFVIGGVIMRQLIIKPIQTSEDLNFDYTKPSPVSFVPVTSSPVSGFSPSASSSAERIPHSGDRPIPYNHKLRLTVSLTMPESEYNRNLGIFQVRVECLSYAGKVTASSSYPTMLEFKSQPIRFAEAMFRSIPLLAGFQSEVQLLKIGAVDFTEGLEPTACFKVTLERRAEYKAVGAGIPEVKAASLRIESHLPSSKRMLWNWRRTTFVWVSIFSFLIELVMALVFFKPMLFPGGTIRKVIGAEGRSRINKISM